jgi:hypothetical protein
MTGSWAYVVPEDRPIMGSNTIDRSDKSEMFIGGFIVAIPCKITFDEYNILLPRK